MKCAGFLVPNIADDGGNSGICNHSRNENTRDSATRTRVLTRIFSFHLHRLRTSSFSSARPDKWKAPIQNSVNISMIIRTATVSKITDLDN